MSKREKLLKKLLSKPKDFKYGDIKGLLQSFGYAEDMKGRTSGSRVAFVNKTTGHIIRLHKPHPESILKMYQVDQLVEEISKLLEKSGDLK